VFGNLGGKLADLDLAEVHLLDFLDLILVLFKTLFDLAECAHSKMFDIAIYLKISI
jgi:hypothetical protein